MNTNATTSTATPNTLQENVGSNAAQPLGVKVRIHSISPAGSLRARCSLELGGCFAVRGVKLMECKNGLYLSMPSYKVGDEYKNHCFPVTAAFHQTLLDAVAQEYEQSLGQAQTRSRRGEPEQNWPEVASSVPNAPVPSYRLEQQMAGV